jgi:hypothetical protein
MWRSLSVTTNLGYEMFLIPVITKVTRYTFAILEK